MRHLKSYSSVVILLIVILGGSTYLAFGSSLSQSASDGKTIFQQRCTACHSIGGGKLVGPDLKDVAKRRDSTWLKNFILAPEKLTAAGDPTAKQLEAEYGMTMPNLGLSDSDIQALLAYLENPDVVSQEQAPESIPVMMGNPQRGAEFFSGNRSLFNGGTPCIACHSVAGFGMLEGGKLGPDLTTVYRRFGSDANLAKALATLPFPTMQGIFSKRPLTQNEQSDLLAFFTRTDSSSPWPSSGSTVFFVEFGIAGVLILFIFMGVFRIFIRPSLTETLFEKTSQ